MKTRLRRRCDLRHPLKHIINSAKKYFREHRRKHFFNVFCNVCGTSHGHIGGGGCFAFFSAGVFVFFVCSRLPESSKNTCNFLKVLYLLSGRGAWTHRWRRLIVILFEIQNLPKTLERVFYFLEGGSLISVAPNFSKGLEKIMIWASVRGGAIALDPPRQKKTKGGVGRRGKPLPENGLKGLKGLRGGDCECYVASDTAWILLLILSCLWYC